ncbi:MAG: hypothetical protein ACP6IU_15340 [Candidatus Asgardarchaeia archaeon]
MVYFGSLDMSGKWNIIVFVVWKNPFFEKSIPHVAGLSRAKRDRIISNVLRWVYECNAWAFVAVREVLKNVKFLTRRRISKSRAWRSVLSPIFSRIFNVLRRNGLYPIEALYADLEFSPHTKMLEKIFGTRVYVEKTEKVLPADALAYDVY